MASGDARSTPDGEAEALVVEYGGCDVVTLDEVPTCVLVTERLQLWIEDPEAEHAVVWLDDQRIEPEWYRRDELLGLGLELEVPVQASSVRVVLDRGHGASASWSLRLSAEDPHPAVRRASAAIVEDINEGRLAQARARLESLLREAPWSTDTVYAALAVAHGLAAEEPEHARLLLDEVAGLPASRTPYGRAQLANSRGQVYWKLGRLDEAAIAYREAARYTLRLRDDELELNAPMMYAELLVELGYLGAATHWAQHVRTVLDERPVAPEDAASAWRTLGWIGLQLHAAGRDELDPKAAYHEALALLEPGGAAASPEKVGGVRIGLARAALDAGRPHEALAQLQQIDEARLQPYEHLQALSLEIRARLRQGADEATVAPRIEVLESIAEKVGTPAARGLLAVLRGRVAERTGDVEAAIAHYRRAEALYDEISQLAIFGAGRSTAGALGPEATQRLLDVLVAQKRLPEALCSARLSRARALRPLVLPASLDPVAREELRERAHAHLRIEAQANAMEIAGRGLPGRELQRLRRDAEAQRQALQLRVNELTLARGRHAARLHCEELPARAPGELLLVIHPLEHGFILLAEDDHGIVAHRVRGPGLPPSSEPRQLARLLLEPLREPLMRARRIRVTAIGDAVHLDVHTLPLDGASLQTRAAVSYAVELPGPEPLPPEGPPTALLLGDATGSLWAVSSEIQAAEQHLRRAGWSTRVPADPGSLLQVLGDLAHAELFHYAGHADAAVHEDDVRSWPPYAGGAPGWPSYLQLRPPARLDVQRILELDRAPRWVVLNGCRTGVLDVQNAGISLALAFLVAGSEQVLASPEASDDLVVGELGQRLYEGLESDEPLDLVERLQRVLRERAAAGEPLGRMRVWVR
ncbi:CHAT domain-containing protein [Paraliomyxa miuraensis]|uniref:CHAT domain-containing protein n=1 Tax=Paraliomyxa miuraensis TaxID=376150 RepID=UPI00224EBDBA|nr:CHAT domain-containing protein [Paraliomyxa miuraensis]MCX4247784.1 CHAT domain-containing protein [Paraliomyxa miuraensis]